MLETYDLKPPKDIIDGQDKAAERAKKFLKSRNKKLSSQQKAKVEKQLDKWYTAWKKQTEPQRKRLVRYAELLEGVVSDTNVPFEGCSNITLHYAAGMARTFRATFNKTAYQDEELFFPLPSPDLSQKLNQSPEKLSALEEGFNYSFTRACNGMRTLKEGTIPCTRDGTLVISGDWHREVRRVFDQRIYRDIKTFQKDYPSADEAGCEPETYADILDFFMIHPDSENTGNPGQSQKQPVPGQTQQGNQDLPELVITFEYDHVYKNEPEYRIGPWAKFVRYPIASRKLSDCLFYGYQVQESREEVKVKDKRSEYYSDGAKKALEFTGNDQPDKWDQSLGFVEGITQPQERDQKSVKFIDGCFLMDLDEDGIPEKYLVRYAFEAKALLSLTGSRLRKGIDKAVVFKLVAREDRLEGVSLIGDCEDLFNQIDIGARHENNVRLLTTSPIFMADAKYKDQIDLGRAENVIRPGVTYWVDNPNTMPLQQLPVKNLDVTHDWISEMMLYKQHVELVFGPTQGLSGMQTPGDSKAPASKTQMLLQQANIRIDDYISQFMESGPELAELHSALLFQYAEGPDISYMKGGKLVSFPLDLLADPGLSWGIKRRSIQLTPEFAMARLSAIQQLYIQLLPLLSTNDPIAMELWNRHILACGEPQADKFLISGQNLQKVQQAFQQRMQMQMQMNPNAPGKKAKVAGDIAMHKVLGKTAGEHIAGLRPMAGMTDDPDMMAQAQTAASGQNGNGQV